MDKPLAGLRVAVLEPVIALRSRDELLASMAPAGPINDLAQVFADPQIVARGNAHPSRRGPRRRIADRDRRQEAGRRWPKPALGDGD